MKDDTKCWKCSLCTFENHELMDVCEVCEHGRRSSSIRDPTVRGRSEAAGPQRRNGFIQRRSSSLGRSDSAHQRSYHPDFDLPNALPPAESGSFAFVEELAMPSLADFANMLAENIGQFIGLQRSSLSSPDKALFANLPPFFLENCGGDWDCANVKCKRDNAAHLAFCQYCSEIRPLWSCASCRFRNPMANLECSRCYRRNIFLKYKWLAGQDFKLCQGCLAPNFLNAFVCQKCLYDVDLLPPKTAVLPLVFESDLMETLLKADEVEAANVMQSIRVAHNNWTRGDLFVDPEFSTATAINSKDFNWHPNQDGRARENVAAWEELVWLRPSQMGPPVFGFRPVFTVFQRPCAAHIKQGRLGDCYLITAIALVVQFKSQILDNIFITKQLSHFGAYQLRLCVEGRWRIITVDDLLPCSPQSRWPIFAQIREGQLFTALIEKAFAKIHGSYSALKGGQMTEALAALTGAPVEQAELHERLNADQEKKDVLWAQLASWMHHGYLVAASCGNNYEEAFYDQLGLVSLHGYSVLDVRTIDNGIRLIRLRNPWAQFSWKGDWSDSWSGWTQKLRQQLDPSHAHEGIFWFDVDDLISYDDLILYFTGIDVCKLGRWYETRIPGILPPFASNRSTYGTRLTITETCEVIMTLHQQGCRKLTPRNGTLDLSIIVLEDDNGKIGMLVASCKRQLAEAVSCEAILKSGTYWIITAAFNHWTASGCKSADDIPTSHLAIHAAKSVLVEQTEAIPAFFLAEAFSRLIAKKGTAMTMQEGCVCYCLEKNTSGAMILAENRTNKNILVECSFGGSGESDTAGLVATRRSLKTTDIIPPRSRQIINILTVADRGIGFSYTRLCRSQEWVGGRNAFRNGAASAYCDSSVSLTERNAPALSSLNWGLHRSLPLVKT